MKRIAGLLLLLLAAPGCRRHRMSVDDCRLVLDRIVELELAERGFRDPELARRRQVQLRGKLADELGSCTGRRVHDGVLACVTAARSAEEISHGCLR
jgi:hypothetical protein